MPSKMIPGSGYLGQLRLVEYVSLSSELTRHDSNPNAEEHMIPANNNLPIRNALVLIAQSPTVSLRDNVPIRSIYARLTVKFPFTECRHPLLVSGRLYLTAGPVTMPSSTHDPFMNWKRVLFKTLCTWLHPCSTYFPALRASRVPLVSAVDCFEIPTYPLLLSLNQVRIKSAVRDDNRRDLHGHRQLLTAMVKNIGTSECQIINQRSRLM